MYETNPATRLRVVSLYLASRKDGKYKFTSKRVSHAYLMLISCK